MYRTATILLLLTALTLALGCKAGKTANEQGAPSMTDGRTQGALLVLLKPEVEPATIETAFARYELKNGGRASRTQNKYRFTYNTKTGELEAMMKSLTDHPGVKSATVSKPIQ